MRIAIAGWQHETNTFSPIKTTLAHFTQADVWPALTTGNDILACFKDMNIPVAGFITEASRRGFQLVPLQWCSAVPAGIVTAAAFNTLLSELLNQLRHCGPVDAIYLDLHGAMVSEEYEDAEGEILRAVRAQVGNDIPIVASLDLHANVSPLMLAKANVMIAYQTYPHVDMAVTGAKLVDLLTDALQYKMMAKSFSFIAPVTSQCTLIEPAKTIYQTLQRLEKKHAVILSFTQGFSLADTCFTRPCLFGYGQDEVVLQRCIDELASLINDSKKTFKSQLHSPSEAIENVQAQLNAIDKPFIFVDTQDNPGCGGAGSTTGILNELIKQGIRNSMVATWYEPIVAAMAHEQGVGKMVPLSLGGEVLDVVQAKVIAIGDGAMVGQGPFYKGCPMQYGPVALLDINGVQVIVASIAAQAADRVIFEHLGIDYRAKKIIVLKSSVHFRADFQSMAEDILLVKSPGLNTAELSELVYTQLNSKVELL